MEMLILRALKTKSFLGLFVVVFGMFGVQAQSYYFVADYGIFQDKYEDLSEVQTFVEDFEYQIEVPLRDGMLLNINLGSDWEGIDKRSKNSIKAFIDRPYDPALKLIKMDKVKVSGSKKIKSLFFKGFFRSGQKIVRIEFFIPLPKIVEKDGTD